MVLLKKMICVIVLAILFLQVSLDYKLKDNICKQTNNFFRVNKFKQMIIYQKLMKFYTSHRLHTDFTI